MMCVVTGVDVSCVVMMRMVLLQVPSFAMADLLVCLKPNHGYGEL